MMKNKYSILLALLALIVVCTSCKEDPLLKEAREFALIQDEVGVYEKDKTKPIFVYDEDKHQLAANPMQFMCRIQTDDQAKMLQMTLDKQPTLAATCKLTVTDQFALINGGVGLHLEITGYDLPRIVVLSVALR